VGAVPYAVTELLEGESLSDRLRSGPLNPAKALNVAIQIADGLAAAHAGGIIHRDIKPENIFLTHDGRAKILDFGIARIEQPARSPGMDVTGRHQTSSQFLVGTAGYMSPEQVRGKSIDPRTDIFSLGATIYEMLTGRRAFSRDSPVETLGAVLRDDPMKYPDAEKIPEGLRGFVVRSLEKDPADRYQSARDLLLDLRAYQAEQLSETADRVRFRSEPPWRHRRTRVLLRAAAAVVIFLVGLYAGSCWERGRGPDSGSGSPPAAAR
jgi:serine/threonine protein kinase